MVPEIVQTLRMHFGCPEFILQLMVEKARQMPHTEDTLVAIIDFAMCVRYICSTIEACKLDGHLNNPMLVKELLEKLSNNYKLQWGMLPKPNSIPTLRVFRDWLYSIADAASQLTSPVYSKKSGVINAHTEVEVKNEPKCFACNKQKSNCSEFIGLPIDERWSIIRYKNICRKCFKINGNVFWSRRSLIGSMLAY